MRFSGMALAAVVMAGCTVPTMADVNIGGNARNVAMGGAGLASIVNPSATSEVNPAALGLMPKSLNLQIPSIGMRVQGAGLSDIRSWANKIWDISGPDALQLARTFGTTETSLDIDASGGIGGAPVSILAQGEGRIKIIPNAAFRQFASTGVLPSDPSTMQAVVWAEAVAALPAVSTGFKLPKVSRSQGDIYLGAKLRMVQGKYIRQTIGWSGSLDPDHALATSDEPIQSERGLAGDVGLIYSDKLQKTSYGVSVTNFLKPNMGNIRQESVWNLGMAMYPTKDTVIVADLVNVTKAYDEGAHVRLGMEVKPVKGIALRAGYSEYGFTSGFGIFGIDVAYAKKAPISIARTIRF